MTPQLGKQGNGFQVNLFCRKATILTSQQLLYHHHRAFLWQPDFKLKSSL